MGDQGYFLLVNGHSFKWSNVWKVLWNQKRASRILHTNLCFKSMVSRMILGKVDTTIPKPACCRKFGGSPLLLHAFTRIAVLEDWLGFPCENLKHYIGKWCKQPEILSVKLPTKSNKSRIIRARNWVLKAIQPKNLTWIPKMIVWKRWFFDINMAIFGIYVTFLGGTSWQRNNEKPSSHHSPPFSTIPTKNRDTLGNGLHLQVLFLADGASC